ncbi:hypothetical protein SNE40_021242 [Patella caerulea]|uniref:Uncharacterized protein n=1 Tax=Patella caerulea TaxID=87958 RepID=A0AAN8IWF5_PATCE
MLGIEIAKAGGQVVHANGDADLDIVLEAVNTSLIHSTTVIGEDTDLLVLLLYHLKHPVDSEKLYFRTDKEAKHIKVYDIALIKQIMGERVCKRLLFLHAFTGCDTTSRIFRIGKSTAFSRLMKSIKLGKSADLFTTVGKNVEEISTAGCEAMLTLFNSKEESLAKLRHNQLTSKVFSSKGGWDGLVV